MIRYAWLIAGHLALATGLIGVFLPILPTTPFLLLAAFCYGRGSEHFEAWLLAHPRFGPLIIEWRQHGVIRPTAKTLAASCLCISIAYVISRPQIPAFGKIAMVCITLPVLVYILSRPSRPC